MSGPTNTAVQVVIGAGSIGQAIARRTGAGKHLLLADFSTTSLHNAKTALEDAGHTVITRRAGGAMPPPWSPRGSTPPTAPRCGPGPRPPPLSATSSRASAPPVSPRY